MKIYIGSDHAGYKLKEIIKKELVKNKINFEDLGTNTNSNVDYPLFGKKVAKKVASEKDSKGILICGTGTGMVIVANRIKGIRASICYDEYSAIKSREDNDSNVLCLRGREFSIEKNKRILNLWLKTKFSRKSRHVKRIKLLDKL